MPRKLASSAQRHRLRTPTLRSSRPHGTRVLKAVLDRHALHPAQHTLSVCSMSRHAKAHHNQLKDEVPPRIAADAISPVGNRAAYPDPNRPRRLWNATLGWDHRRRLTWLGERPPHLGLPHFFPWPWARGEGATWVKSCILSLRAWGAAAGSRLSRPVRRS